jgi:hypothetical protein
VTPSGRASFESATPSEKVTLVWNRQPAVGSVAAAEAGGAGDLSDG